MSAASIRQRHNSANAWLEQQKKTKTRRPCRMLTMAIHITTNKLLSDAYAIVIGQWIHVLDARGLMLDIYN